MARFFRRPLLPSAVILGFVGVLPWACSPLHPNLDELSENFGSMGGAGGSPSNPVELGGGGAGAGGATPILAECGNGKREATESCDTGGESADCDSDCSRVACGDGIANSAAGEDCDDAGKTEGCYTCDGKGPPCVVGCDCSFFDGNFYALCLTLKSYQDASADCETKGYRLVSVGTKQEDDFLRRSLFQRSVGEAWIGGKDREGDQVFSWEDGTPFFQGNGVSGDVVDQAYNNWSPGEPGDLAGNQDCVVVGATTGGWMDLGCTDTRAFVCELEGSPESCGDGELDPGEVCDQESETDTCDADCTTARCGDGKENRTSGEVCDDGNQDDLDACTSDCEDSQLAIHYGFSEVVGKQAYDASRQGAHLSIIGSSSVLDDLPGALFQNPDYATVQDDALGFSGDFTISVGVRVLANGGFRSILMDDPNFGEPAFVARITGTEFEVFDAEADGGPQHPPEAALRIPGNLLFTGDDFVALAYTCKEGLWTAYLNGNEVGTYEDTVCRLPEGSTTYYVGAAPGGAQDHFGGRLADLRLYTRALSASEIKTLAGRIPE